MLVTRHPEAAVAAPLLPVVDSLAAAKEKLSVLNENYLQVYVQARRAHQFVQLIQEQTLLAALLEINQANYNAFPDAERLTLETSNGFSHDVRSYGVDLSEKRIILHLEDRAPKAASSLGPDKKATVQRLYYEIQAIQLLQEEHRASIVRLQPSVDALPIVASNEEYWREAPRIAAAKLVFESIALWEDLDLAPCESKAWTPSKATFCPPLSPSLQEMHACAQQRLTETAADFARGKLGEFSWTAWKMKPLESEGIDSTRSGVVFEERLCMDGEAPRYAWGYFCPGKTSSLGIKMIDGGDTSNWLTFANVKLSQEFETDHF